MASLRERGAVSGAPLGIMARVAGIRRHDADQNGGLTFWPVNRSMCFS